MRMCELLVGLPDVSLLDATGVVRVHIETRGPRPRCAGCGGPVIIKDRPVVEPVDLPVFGPVGSVGVAQAAVGVRDGGVPGRVVHR
jgi:hypothetical protein